MTLQLISCLIAFQSSYMQSGGTRVAVVNVALASERYLKTADLESQFESRRAAMRQESETIRDRIEQKRRILTEQLKPGTDAYTATLEELAILEARAQFFVESKTRELDTGLAMSLRSIYMDIQSAVRSIAEERGFEVVLAADEMPEAQEGSPSAAKQHIILQKVVYWSPRIDITNDVITRLNSTYGGNRGMQNLSPSPIKK